jgi:hypothetical protein
MGLRTAHALAAYILILICSHRTAGGDINARTQRKRSDWPDPQTYITAGEHCCFQPQRNAPEKPVHCFALLFYTTELLKTDMEVMARIVLENIVPLSSFVPLQRFSCASSSPARFALDFRCPFLLPGPTFTNGLFQVIHRTSFTPKPRRVVYFSSSRRSQALAARLSAAIYAHLVTRHLGAQKRDRGKIPFKLSRHTHCQGHNPFMQDLVPGVYTTG